VRVIPSVNATLPQAARCGDERLAEEDDPQQQRGAG
jgi:hypothetical protein